MYVYTERERKTARKRERMRECTATRYNTLQHNLLLEPICANTLAHTATRCNTPQHTATHSITVPRDCFCQHNATFCNTTQRTAI